MKNLKSLLIIIALFVFIPQVSASDYELFPRQDYKVHELFADIVFNPESGHISGNVRYEISPFSIESQAISFQIDEIAVDSVFVNGLLSEFGLIDGRLDISIPQNLIDPRRRIDIQVFYYTSSENKLLRTSKGSWFSSTIPLSRSRWIPIIEHPSVEALYTMRIQVPNPFTAISNGYLREEIRQDEDTIWEWRSDVALPLSEIGIAVGEFQMMESLFGMKTVKIFKESRIVDRSSANEVLRNLIIHLGQTQRQFRKEYPFDGLNIIFLEDHLWEPKFYQAGLGFVFKNAGSLQSQALAIADAQWFGIYHRPVRWSDASSVLYLQTVLQKSRGDNVYAVDDFPESALLEWNSMSPFAKKQIFNHLSLLSSFEWSIISSDFNQILQKYSGMIAWNDYKRFWYSKSGRLFSMPDLEVSKEIEEQSLEYINVFIHYAAQNNRVTFTVEPRTDVASSDISLLIRRFIRNDVLIDTLIVNRAGGEFALDQTLPLQNVRVESIDSPAINVVEVKDFSMWFYQLRNAVDIDDKIQAAREMPRFRDDPDIQLALSDLLRSETNALVRAALIQSFGEIVQGAAGTEQLFIQNTRTTKADELRASVEALWHYVGNSDAISAVSRVALNSDELSVIVAAFNTFKNIASESQFRELAASILMGERPAPIKAAMVSTLFSAADITIAVDTALDILEGNFPYVMREKSFQLLLQYEKTEELGVSILRIANDVDPRIRALAIKHVHLLQPRQMNDLLERRFFIERDPRVRILFEMF